MRLFPVSQLLLVLLSVLALTMKRTTSAPTDIRLVNGNSFCSGRIEILHNGTWGTVCDDLWDSPDAAVACRQLGCGNVVQVKSNSFGSGSGPIWLDEVQCNGNEAALQNCVSAGFGITNCDHTEDVGIICGDIPSTTSAPTTSPSTTSTSTSPSTTSPSTTSTSTTSTSTSPSTTSTSTTSTSTTSPSTTSPSTTSTSTSTSTTSTSTSPSTTSTSTTSPSTTSASTTSTSTSTSTTSTSTTSTSTTSPSTTSTPTTSPSTTSPSTTLAENVIGLRVRFSSVFDITQYGNITIIQQIKQELLKYSLPSSIELKLRKLQKIKP